MNAAGYVLTGIRRIRRRAHPPMILAHGLTSDFFGVDELADAWPDFESFHVWPATARVLWALRDLDRLAGQSSVAHFGCWREPTSRKFMLCSRREAKWARRLNT
jgi:hypothetical protein